MRAPILVLTLILLATAPSGAAVRVPSRVEVDKDAVTLADLVPGAPGGWAEVRLGPAPRPGRSRTLEAAWIRQRARTVGAADQLALPDRVVVERPGARVGRDALVEAVRAAVRPRVAPDEEIRVLSVGLPGPVPRGGLDLRPRLPEGSLPSSFTVPVDVWVDGTKAATGWVRVEVFRGRPAVVLTRDIRRGEVIGLDDVGVRTARSDATTLSEPQQVVGKRLRRSLRAGTALRRQDLEAVPVVSRGDVVRLVARVGGVTASTLGKALGSAGIGEVLQVENLGSGRTVAGIVRGGGLVEVATALGR